MSAQHQSQKQQNLGGEEADAVVMCCKTARPPAVSHSEAVNVSATLQPPAAPGDDVGPLFPPLSRTQRRCSARSPGAMSPHPGRRQ